MTDGDLHAAPSAPDANDDPSRKQHPPRTSADIARALYERRVFIPQTLDERQRLALGVALAAHVYADVTVLERGAATAARWIAERGPDAPRSLRDWEVLCRAGEIDSVLWALQALSPYANEMRASMPFDGVLDAAEVAAIRARVGAEKPPPQVPLSVWTAMADIVDTHFSPVELLSMAMFPQPMLPDATGRVRTVIEALEEGDYEPVLAMLRWVTTPPDSEAPLIADRSG